MFPVISSTNVLPDGGLMSLLVLHMLFEFYVLHTMQNFKKMPPACTEGTAHQITWFCSMRTS
jgi:hypothetical protein